MRRRYLGALGGAAALFLAVAASAAPHRVPPTPQPEKLARHLEIVVNGTPVALGTPPIVLAGRLFLPLRPTLGALGIPLTPIDGALTAPLPAGTVAVRVGSARATIDGVPFDLGAAVVERKDVTYVPFSLFARAFSEAIFYDQRGSKIEILSPYFIGAPPPGGSAITGIVSALDLTSIPNSITVVTNAAPRTIAFDSHTKIYLEDVSTRSEVPADPSQLRVGDALHAVLAKNGRLLEVHGFFKSTSGVVAATSQQALVLRSGVVVTPGRATEVLLEGAPADLSDLAVGDYVTVRSNPETGELRQIIATRTAAVPSSPTASSGPVAISAFVAHIDGALRAGSSFSVTMSGTPGGQASFDIGEYVTGVPMQESASGTYSGAFTVPQHINLVGVPIYGHLRAGDASAQAQAAATLTALTTPPQLSDFAPRPGSVVNDDRPTIYATFGTASNLGVDPDSIEVSVDGTDVSAAATRTPGYVIYTPESALPAGPTKVRLRVRDQAGNTTSRTWTFAIETKS